MQMYDESIRKVNRILATIATHYMNSYQGDILLDHFNIIKRLEERGEIELYVAQSHFDTEIRFEYGGRTTEEARDDARNHSHWGDYVITLTNKNGKIGFGIESSSTNKMLPDFPMDRLSDKYAETYDILLWDKRHKLTPAGLKSVSEYNVDTNKFQYTPKQELHTWGGRKVDSIVLDGDEMVCIAKYDDCKDISRCECLDNESFDLLVKEIDEEYEIHPYHKF